MCKKINLTPNTGNTMPYGIPYPPYVFQPTTVNNSTKKTECEKHETLGFCRRIYNTAKIYKAFCSKWVGEKKKKSPSTWLIIDKLFAPNTIKYIYFTLQVLAGPIEMCVSN